MGKANTLLHLSQTRNLPSKRPSAGGNPPLHDPPCLHPAQCHKSDAEVAATVRCHPQSVFNVRKAFVTRGLDAALHRKIRDKPPTPKYDAPGLRVLSPSAGSPGSVEHDSYNPGSCFCPVNIERTARENGCRLSRVAPDGVPDPFDDNPHRIDLR